MSAQTLKPLSTGWRLPCVERVATARNSAIAAISCNNATEVAKMYAKSRHHQRLYLGFAVGEVTSVLASPRAPVHVFLSRRAKATQRACAQYLRNISETDFLTLKRRSERCDRGFHQGVVAGLVGWWRPAR